MFPPLYSLSTTHDHDIHDTSKNPTGDLDTTDDVTPRYEKGDPLDRTSGQRILDAGEGGDTIEHPAPQRHPSIPLSPTTSAKANKMDISPQRQSLAAPRSSRGGSSPSRSPRTGLTALSSLQPMSMPKPHNAGLSESPGKPPSLVRSMSRKQSMYDSAAKWDQDQYMRNMASNENGSFSKLILVKAPEDVGLKQRSKSSSALAPFTFMSNKLAVDPTSDRGPRRSFAAASFGESRPLHVRAPSASNISPTSHRVYDPTAKTMSPTEVWELAESLKSPVAIPEGGFKGAELKRRKSAGSSISRRSSNHSLNALADSSPQDPPLALEPVEYVQLDDDVLLPYVDRPAEVAELIQHPANDQLFNQLRAAFPKKDLRNHWQALSPEEWNWDEFNKHLQLARAECPDYAWIFRARQACRQRSVALWEKLGTMLGCDGDLLNAGGDDGLPSTWGVDNHDDDDEYDDYKHTQVWIEGLQAHDPEEAERAERDFASAFGEIVEDNPGMGLGGMGAIGEDEDEEEVGETPLHRRTPAQRAGHQDSIDPFHSPNLKNAPLSTAASATGNGTRSVRSRSFVGLTILTSPKMSSSPGLGQGQGHGQGQGSFSKSPSIMSPGLSMSSSYRPVYQNERGPDAVLFPGSFRNLSVEPNLGRAAAAGQGGVPGVPGGKGAKVSIPLVPAGGGGWKLNRKQSGAGLSESAITFASESDYGPIHDEVATGR